MSVRSIARFLKMESTGGLFLMTAAVLALVVSDANAAAIRLYHRNGFLERAQRPMLKGDWDGPGQDWVLMVKPLEDPLKVG